MLANRQSVSPAITTNKFLNCQTTRNFDFKKLSLNSEKMIKDFLIQPTILLVAQNSDWLADVCEWLKERGYNVLIADSGDRAFCLAQRFQPDLIVSEIALPDFSGIQLCYMTRADKNLNEVLFVLVGELECQNNDTSFEALRAGANDYFAKSSRRILLKLKIERLLQHQRSENEFRKTFQNLLQTEQDISEIVRNASNLADTFRRNIYDDFNFRETANFQPNLEQSELKSARTNQKSNNREKIYFEVVG